MIKVTEVVKRFEDFEALSKVSFEIPKGKIFGLVGSNGAGKSTLLRIMAGVYKPNAGGVTYDGEPIWDNVSVKEKLVFVPDELYFLPGASMNRMARFYQNYYPTFSMERYQELVEQLRLDPKRKLSGFSKGMQRQAATVLALSCRPDYYFFDETLDGLDPVMREVVKSIIYEDICERNVTAVITSHSLRELENTCDHLALLHKGGLVYDYDVESVKASQVKVQFALSKNLTREEMEEKLAVTFQSFKQEGRVNTAIFDAGEKDIQESFQVLEPLYVDVLPMTLEELFTYEMEALGYSFDLESKEEKHESSVQ